MIFTKITYKTHAFNMPVLLIPNMLAKMHKNSNFLFCINLLLQLMPFCSVCMLYFLADYAKNV